jgi:hypothetical protein
MATTPLDPQAYGLSEYQASVLREVFLDRPIEGQGARHCLRQCH